MHPGESRDPVRKCENLVLEFRAPAFAGVHKGPLPTPKQTSPPKRPFLHYLAVPAFIRLFHSVNKKMVAAWLTGTIMIGRAAHIQRAATGKSGRS